MPREQWMISGDRSHINLVALDSLNPTYPGWQEDLAKAEHAHTSNPMEFQDRFFEIKEKQNIFDGNRTHPRLVTLDSLRLHYPGWKNDCDKAQEYHVCFPELFEGKISGMIEKQKMHDGDRSHSNLVALDALKLTYPGHEEDVREAEDIHTSKPFMFKEKLFEISEKQNMHLGDRSHPRLAVLDSITFNYPGWERDFSKAEHYHVRFPELFKGKLKGMKEKQRINGGDRTHPNLIALDLLAPKLSYPGFRTDLQGAEKAHTNLPQEFDARLFEIREKQNIYQGDRSHARLVELDKMVLTYPNWQWDFDRAEVYHLRYPELFMGKLKGMREKQRIYRGELLRQQAALEKEQLNMASDPYSNTKSIENDADTKVGNRECIICCQFERTHAFVPCGHLCVCENCVEVTIETQMCPICRQKPTQAIKVYFS